MAEVLGELFQAGQVVRGQEVVHVPERRLHPARQRLVARRAEQRVTLSERVKAIAWKAQHRLHARHRKLLGRGKCQQQVVTALGRELLGFIWAIGVTVETEQKNTQPAAA